MDTHKSLVNFFQRKRFSYKIIFPKEKYFAFLVLSMRQKENLHSLTNFCYLSAKNKWKVMETGCICAAMQLLV